MFPNDRYWIPRNTRVLLPVVNVREVFDPPNEPARNGGSRISGGK
jgi:hypothetical protein